jgi:putative oxidoreductase
MPHTTKDTTRSVPLKVPVLTRRAGPEQQAGPQQQTGPQQQAGPTGLERSRVGRALVTCAGSVAARARALDHAVSEVLRPVMLPVLRIVLGLLFLWFGALKVTGDSPVAALVAKTLPFANAHLVVLVLGSVEVALGLVLVTGKFLRLALPALVLHLAGTFTTFVVVPSLMFRDGDPLLLTADGEFVMKNVILIAAALVLIAHTSRATTNRRARPAAAA